MATTEVNGKICLDPAYEVKETDVIKYDGQKVSIVLEKVVIMLHKPMKVITTVKDTHGRKTVLDIVPSKYRLTPVGRLDQDTTGLLLLTNDGNLSARLTNAKSTIKKLYHIELDKDLTQKDFDKISKGVKLDDEVVTIDEISYVEGDKKQIGLQLSSGKNRLVVRIFISLGYKVERLDRVLYGGLTKKDLSRGKWRNLTQQELHMLNMIK